MGSHQQCHLKWNNYQSNIATSFEKLLSGCLLVDVTLACDDATIGAHKVVLSACSSYFHKIFVNNPSQHPVIFFKDATFQELQSLLHFMYKGEADVTEEMLGNFLKLAKSLKIKGLSENSVVPTSSSCSSSLMEAMKAPKVDSFSSAFVGRTVKADRCKVSGNSKTSASPSSSNEAVVNSETVTPSTCGSSSLEGVRIVGVASCPSGTFTKCRKVLHKNSNQDSSSSQVATTKRRPVISLPCTSETSKHTVSLDSCQSDTGMPDISTENSSLLPDGHKQQDSGSIPESSQMVGSSGADKSEMTGVSSCEGQQELITIKEEPSDVTEGLEEDELLKVKRELLDLEEGTRDEDVIEFLEGVDRGNLTDSAQASGLQRMDTGVTFASQTVEAAFASQTVEAAFAEGKVSDFISSS